MLWRRNRRHPKQMLMSPRVVQIQIQLIVAVLAFEVFGLLQLAAALGCGICRDR